MFEGRKYELKAEDPQSRDDWVKSLKILQSEVTNTDMNSVRSSIKLSDLDSRDPHRQSTGLATKASHKIKLDKKLESDKLLN